MTGSDPISPRLLAQPFARWSNLTIEIASPMESRLPASLRLLPSFPFVGRSRELAALRALMPLAGGEGRRIALVGGEPGSGKSRLVREFAHEISAEGVLVLYGACDAVVRTPYRPFVEALGQLVRSGDPDELRADLGTAGGELTRLLPDLPQRVGELPAPIAADADTERHRLHTAVGDLMANVGRRQPVLFMLEDGHWADGATLLLVRHLARATTDARMLLVATFRDTEADVPAELADALADLRRSDDVVRLRLGGLTEHEIADFVRGAAGAPGLEVPALAREIEDLTDGNAFLVCELWRALVETGALAVEDGTARLTRPLAELATPESVREVVSQRLARLDPRTRDLLEIAAVVGPEFHFEIVRRAAALEERELLAALEHALRSGIVEEVTGPGLAYRFTHELVRRALYDRLTGLRRAELHLRVGEALEDADTAPRGRSLADLAHHFSSAAPIGEPARAIDYNLLAADAAMAALAFDEAAERLQAALELGVADERRRAAIELDLGTACYRAGKSLSSLGSFRAAAEIARRLGDGELLARAAIGLENTCWRPGMVDQGALELLEEASGALSEQDSSLRVRLLGGLSRALDFQGDRVRGVEVRDRAIAMARRLGDRPGLATVLIRAYWARGALPLEEILAMLTEARELAEEIGDIEIEAEAMEWRIAALLALGDLEQARRELAAVLELAQQTRQPFILHVAEHYGSAIALSDGRLEEAEAAALRSHEWSRLLTGREASGVYGIQMFGLRREQGRLAELAPVVRVLANGDRGGAWGPGLAAVLAELGMVDDARAELTRIRSVGLDAFRPSLWLASLAYLTDAAAALGDESTAAMVYPELVPHAGTNVMIGHGVAFYGAADRYLGMLAATLGEPGLAERHFDDALELNRRMAARTWVAHTAYEHGRLLLARGESGRAAPLLAEAARLADEIGLVALSSRLLGLGSEPARALPDGLSPREVAILQLVARGLSNREIGAELVISEHTAANHVRSILRKSGCANRTEATAYAYRRGLVAS